MQFRDISTKQGLIEDITFLLGIDINGYGIEDRTRNINERYRQVWSMIFESYDGWKFQDDNLSANPYADQTLTSGTATYSLPTGSLSINMVLVKDSAGNYQIPLEAISQEEYQQMGAESYNTTNGVPRYYLLYEDQLQLVPGPNYTFASTGIRVYFDQGVSTFAITDTTKVPGFASPFHRALSIGASLDYAQARGLTDKIPMLLNLWNDYERRIRSFYSKRFIDKRPARIPAGMDLMDELT